MRTRLVLLALGLALAALPAPAQAHVDVCDFGDAQCLAECEASHAGPGPHECGVRQPCLPPRCDPTLLP